MVIKSLPRPPDISARVKDIELPNVLFGKLSKCYLCHKLLFDEFDILADCHFYCLSIVMGRKPKKPKPVYHHKNKKLDKIDISCLGFIISMAVVSFI